MVSIGGLLLLFSGPTVRRVPTVPPGATFAGGDVYFGRNYLWFEAFVDALCN